MTIEYKDSKRIVGLSLTAGSEVGETSGSDETRTLGVSSSRYRGGIKIATGSALIGQTLSPTKGIKFELKRTGLSSGASVSRFEIWNDTTIISSATVTFDPPTKVGTSYAYVEFFPASTVTLQANDRITIATDGGATNYYTFKSNASGSYDTTKTHWTESTYNSGSGGSWTDDTGRDGNFKFTLADVGDVKPTDIQDNSILVEKDTARRYWASNKDTIEDDYSSASGWTSSGAGNISITGGQVSASSLGNNDGEDRIYRTVSGVDSTDVTVQFEVTFSAWTSGAWAEGIAQLQSCTQDAVTYSGTQPDCDVAGVNLNKGHSNSYFSIITKDGTNSAVFTSGTATVSQGTKYYLTFEKSGNDMTLTSRTGSHSGSTHDTITKTQTGITGLNTLVHGTLTGYAGGTGYTTSYTIDNLVVSPVSHATWNAPSKTPAEIGDLKVHYDATVGVTASSNSVSAWADQSGNGKTLSSVSNPTRVEAGQNGKDYIDFNSSKSMRASGLSEDAPRPFTMVAVINPRNTSDQTIIRWGQSPYLALYQYPANTYYMTGGTDVGLSDSTLDGSWNAFFMDFKSNADGGTLQINLDTANAVSGDIGNNGTSGSGGNSQPSTLHVGINGTNNNWYANCRYAEIIIFDKVLTAYEKEQLYGHLKTKWGLP